jgi:hypothetical protein
MSGMLERGEDGYAKPFVELGVSEKWGGVLQES